MSEAIDEVSYKYMLHFHVASIFKHLDEIDEIKIRFGAMPSMPTDLIRNKIRKLQEELED